METSDHQVPPPPPAAAAMEEQQQPGMAGNAGVGVDDDRRGTSSSMQQESATRSVPFMLHVGVALILTWIASAFSINSIFIVVIVFIYLYQVEKQGRYREHRWIRHEERRKAHMKRLDDGETVRWLNQAIRSIWPVCLESFSSQQFLMPLVPWFLTKYKPKFVREVLLQKLHLGSRAPVITLIRALDKQIDGDHLIIEAAMEFSSGEDMSAEMSVAFRYPRLRINFYISKLYIEGKVKIAMKFVNGWPVIGSIRFCFAQLPKVQMAARPLSRGGIDVTTYIPGAAKWLEATIETALEQSLVEPNLLVVDMEKIVNNVMLSSMTPEQMTALAQEDKGPAIAILHLEILEAKQLRIADRNDPFVLITLGSSEMKTTVKTKGLNPTWNEQFQLPIYSWDYPNILILQVHDSSCTVLVSDYKDGALHEENVHLQTKVKHQMKKVGQLRFAMLIEKIPQSEDNQTTLAALQEPYMDRNAATTDLSSDVLSERLKNQLPLPANNTYSDQRHTKDKSSHSRTSSAGSLETTQSLVAEVQLPAARNGEWGEIIDVKIGLPGAFIILHPGEVSPKVRSITTQKLGKERKGNLSEKVKNEQRGARKPRINLPNLFHRHKRSAGGGSQESLTAMETELDPSVTSSVEDSGELLSPWLPEHSGPVKLILEDLDAATTSSIMPDEEPQRPTTPPPPSPSKMFLHRHALTPILSRPKHADPEDEDDKTWPLDPTPNSTDFPEIDDWDNTNHNNNNDNFKLQNGLRSAERKSKKGGLFGKIRKMRIRGKKQKALQPLDNDEDQITRSQELYLDGDTESIYNSTYILEKEDEPPIHEDEKKIINTVRSQRGSSLRDISDRMLVKLGLGPKKPS